MKNIKKSTIIRLITAAILIIVALFAVFGSTNNNTRNDDETIIDSVHSLLGADRNRDKLQSILNEGQRELEQAQIPQYEKPEDEQSDAYKEYVSNRDEAFNTFLENFPE